MERRAAPPPEPKAPRRGRWPLGVLALVVAALAAALYTHSSRRSPPPSSAYADPQRCRPCHAEIYSSYQRVAMARSLYRPTAANIIEDYGRNNRFDHAASHRHYEMLRRGDRFYQRRYQLDARGRPVHVFEQEITYIIGSGNHARSYLHLSASGELTQLPVTWYSQEHRWGMSPGYDRPKHWDFTRPIDYGCLFCHNAYPNIPPGADRYAAADHFPQELPQGIDCQRCHGPGARHIELASSGHDSPEKIRAAIVNPARLSPDVQMDVCQQCHLETTSAKLPQAVRRFARPAFSFRPGQRLSDYLVHFDHPPGSGYDDKFEIVNAAYRLRKSACFLKSGGRLTCITCHNPHHTPQGEEAVAQFRARCLACHAPGRSAMAAPHADLAAGNCIPCHMPRRRTDDVVHVVMTDHWIQKQKPSRDLLAPLAEKDDAYHGDLALYDPPRLPQPDHDLYFGIALVIDGADRPRGVSLLEKAIAAAGSSAPIEARIELAGACMAERNFTAAADNYKKALQMDPALAKIRYNLGRALEQTGDIQSAIAAYEQAVGEDPNLVEAQNNLATLLLRSGRAAEAIEHYQAAIRARDAYAEPRNNLGNLYAAQGRLPEAQAEIEQALSADPDLAAAHNNLGKVLGMQGDLDRAVPEFEQALQLDPRFAEAHYNLGRALHALGRREAAMAEYRRAIELNSSLAEPHLSLGVALGEQGRFDAAIEQFRAALAIRPDYPEAKKNLDVALAAKR